MMSTRLSRQDWLAAGLKVLGTAGTAGLTIEKMTSTLGVTKGSFYHHFRNVRDFREQLIAHWSDQYLSTSSDIPQDPNDLLPLLDSIMGEAFGPVTEPELAIRIWAHQDDYVRSHVEKVDAARREFILTVFRTVTENEHQSQLMADMLFALSIGSITALPSIPAKRVLEIYREFKTLFGLDAPAG
jgi:AcrR family transcriptional regulator